MLAKLREMKQDEGFTLVELLVVIAILGVLAGIVVFSVAGLNDNSQASACKTEKSTLATAEEAYYASQTPTHKYTDSASLVTAKFLQSAPTWYQVKTTDVVATPPSYTISATAAGTAAGCS